jgi:hypothetical protein
MRAAGGNHETGGLTLRNIYAKNKEVSEEDSKVRTTIQDEAQAEYRIIVDIRDESYLVRQLQKRENGIFVRYFKELPEQIKNLLGEEDPLRIANDKMKRSMLASLGAFVFNPRAANVKEALFDQIVLCCVVSSKSKESKQDHICILVKGHFEGTFVEDRRVIQSLSRLVQAGLIRQKSNGAYAATEEVLEKLTTAMLETRSSIEFFSSNILDYVETMHRLDESQRGILERNVRNALARVLRLAGPSVSLPIDCVEALDNSEYAIRSTIARELPQEIAQTVLACLSDYIKAPRNSECLSLLARSYRGLCVLDEDPLARAWQIASVERDCIMLDTDAVLFLLIEELPEHKVVVPALRELLKGGISIAIPEHVAHEAADHISRARRTFAKFQDEIRQMPIDMVDKKIWHAVVRGYCYFLAAQPRASFSEYWNKYYDSTDPFRYILHQIDCKIKKVSIVDFMDLDASDHVDLEQILVKVLENKESKRFKAAFRRDPLRNERVAKDVRFALFAAQDRNATFASRPRGYIISSDLAFQYIQRLENWGARSDVHILTMSLPSLSEIYARKMMDDDLVTRFIFSPISVAAALALADQISLLNKVGVALQGVPMQRLDWDLKKSLAQHMSDYRKAQGDDALIAGAAFALAAAAKAAGYDVDPDIDKLAQEYRALSRTAADVSGRLGAAKELIDELGLEFGKTKKGRRKLNRIMKRYGYTPGAGNAQ